MEKEKDTLPDLTEFDFSQADLYQSNPDGLPLRARELEENLVIERSWGSQKMIVGDWVIYKPGSDGSLKLSGVKRKAFLLTYEETGKSGYFMKNSFVLASKIEHDFCFLGVDSDEVERAPAGSYLVLNLDKSQMSIVINGRRDIFFYKEEDLFGRYVKV